MVEPFVDDGNLKVAFERRGMYRLPHKQVLTALMATGIDSDQFGAGVHSIKKAAGGAWGRLTLCRLRVRGEPRTGGRFPVALR